MPQSPPSRIILAVIILIVTVMTASAPARAQEKSNAAPLMRLLKSGRVPPQRLGRIVELVCKRGNAEDLTYVFNQTVSPTGFADKLRLDALNWLADAALTRKIQPSGDLSGLGRLVRSADPPTAPGTQLAAIRLAGAFKAKALMEPLSMIAVDAKTDFSHRRATLDALVDIDGAAARKTVEQLVAAEQPLKVRFLGVAALTRIDLDAAAVLAVDVLAGAKGNDDPVPLINAFLDRRGGAEKLAATIVRKPPAVDVAKLALRHMYSIGRTDAALAAAFSDAAGLSATPEPLSPQQVKELAVQVMAEGDPARGEQVFRRADVSCMKCHAVSKAGGQIGPDLSAVGASSPVDYLINSIMLPNQAIKEAFLTRIVITVAGKVHQGIVVDRDDRRVVLKDAVGKQTVIPTADIDEEEKGSSLMPQGLTKFLTRRELIDLVRFLAELGKPGHYAVRKTPTIQRWRVLKQLPNGLTEETDPEVLREELIALPNDAWTPAYAKVAGGLPLGELLANGSQTIILRAEINVTVAGPVGIDIQSPAKTQIGIDNEPFRGDGRFETNLTPGRHTLTLHIVASEETNGDLRGKLFKVAGSKAEFQVVDGQ